MLNTASQRYLPVSGDENEPVASPWPERPCRAGSWLCGTIVFIMGFAGLIWYTLEGGGASPVFDPRPSSCLEPKLRREWRQLNGTEKFNYIQAVKCVHESPSRLHPDGRLTDDFPWSHRLIEHYAHDAAPFLPWHRYFIHIYEMALRECGYQDALVYWDWTLDWKDPSQSPIWDSELGFGGDGNTNEEETVNHGYCVKSGPFANYTVRYENGTVNPHCLSRGFGCMDNPKSHEIDGTFLSPRFVDHAKTYPDFFNFTLALEMGPHNAIPNGVCGDFYSFDAPADPVFYLHHTQLDRIWWQWQQEKPSRTMEYNGPKHGHSEDKASLSDRLPMYGLAREPEVAEVMDTEGGLLCYRY
ncbi:hypothetical protein N7492_001634 [Penicillium capsulatum]|uniref:Tyrosinase copper-binding domain-containing protein n=1 Tax=Penicillium capsulatum TaxID=69766 RepID=A0A9W9IRY5_9EURO|nr:hypothetical protein N7492_001634 [Penicillium capsulatum]KAJ6129313.1 hypothetical protein N7512_002093 [Penicillium capsulatum]